MKTSTGTTPTDTYECSGKTFKFNDHVCVEMVIGVPDERRTGRLVQVRKGVGDFGSDLYFVRLRDNSLMTFHNVLLRHARDERFEYAFYTTNGRTPPTIPEQSINPDDSIFMEYTINGQWPEVGFIIENPKQPQSGKQMFGMMVTRA